MKKNNKRRRRVDVDLSKLDGIIDSSYERTLERQEGEALRQAIHAMVERLDPGPSTEKSARFSSDSPERAGEAERPPTRGHGRNGVEAFTGAQRVPVPNQEVEAGCRCPDCEKGKIFGKDPSPIIRFVGGPPVAATIYELQRLRCNLCGKTFTAEPPPEVGPEKYDETATSAVGTAKYGHGIPFYRLEAIQQSHGVPLPASTQWELVQEGAAALKPVHEELIRQAAQGSVLYSDDTSMRVMEVSRPEGDTRTGVFTTGVVSTRSDGHQPISVYFTGPQHSGENLRDVLHKRAETVDEVPVVMCDASSWHTSKLEPGTDILLAHCLAHGRRNFVKILDNWPDECRHVLDALGRVYRVDEEARLKELGPKERMKLHKERSGPEMKALRQWLTAQLEEKRTEPNSNLGKAMKYLLTHWDALTLFLRHPGAPLDNNICERALKKVVLHRKNALFYRTMNGADVGDVFMSLIRTCELNKVNAFDYLTQLQRHIEELRANPSAWMPWNYHVQVARAAPG